MSLALAKMSLLQGKKLDHLDTWERLGLDGLYQYGDVYIPAEALAVFRSFTLRCAWDFRVVF